ncbi:MAG: electron transport complex subunit RsxC, partial [Candidatus Omnitrophica bacterium]|nr:electron transport complex subunit RsxC [Candidatus Omnitrophota bacterium]
MIYRTFRGGVHPPESKDPTVDKSIKRAPLPEMVAIPLLQHTGAPCKSLVKAGDKVKRGQLIGKSDKFISSAIHASISGTVAKIEKYSHPVLGSINAVIINSDGKDEPDPSIKDTEGVAKLSAEELRGIIRDAGIVGLGGAAFPAHVKLTPPAGKIIDSVILNGAECEPYLTCDHHLMLEKGAQIIEGVRIILKLTNASNVYIGIESNKMGAAFLMEKILRDARDKIHNARIIALKTKYPQGAEKQLIKSITKREVPPRGLPLDVGCLVVNVGTAYAIYEAVFGGKPLYERAITISGNCVKEPLNLLVRIGTPVKALLDLCGGFTEDPAKMIFGGPMMGLTQFTLDLPIIKGTSGIVFLSKKGLAEYKETSCIRCAKCVDVCPMRLIPTDMIRLVKRGEYYGASEYSIEDCMECGACAYICPSKIPILQWINIGKAEV